jgi:hypothetical protein
MMQISKVVHVMGSPNVHWETETEEGGHLLTVIAIWTKAGCIILNLKTRDSQWNVHVKVYQHQRHRIPHFVANSDLTQAYRCLYRFITLVSLSWSTHHTALVLALSDISLFTNLKEHLRGYHFFSDSVVKTMLKMLCPLDAQPHDSWNYCGSFCRSALTTEVLMLRNIYVKLQNNTHTCFRDIPIPGMRKLGTVAFQHILYVCMHVHECVQACTCVRTCMFACIHFLQCSNM